MTRKDKVRNGRRIRTSCGETGVVPLQKRNREDVARRISKTGTAIHWSVFKKRREEGSGSSTLLEGITWKPLQGRNCSPPKSEGENKHQNSKDGVRHAISLS